MVLEGYSVEERPCSECLQYRALTSGISICTEKLMTVVAKMKVTYKDDEGTCFKSKQRHILVKH